MYLWHTTSSSITSSFHPSITSYHLWSERQNFSIQPGFLDWLLFEIPSTYGFQIYLEKLFFLPGGRKEIFFLAQKGVPHYSHCVSFFNFVCIHFMFVSVYLFMCVFRGKSISYSGSVYTSSNREIEIKQTNFFNIHLLSHSNKYTGCPPEKRGNTTFWPYLTLWSLGSL